MLRGNKGAGVVWCQGIPQSKAGLGVNGFKKKVPNSPLTRQIIKPDLKFFVSIRILSQISIFGGKKSYFLFTIELATLEVHLHKSNYFFI